MKRSFPDDFSIRGEAKRRHPEPLSPVSGRSIERGPLTNPRDRYHNTMSPTSSDGPSHFDRPRYERPTDHDWPGHERSLRWKQPSTEDPEFDSNRRRSHDRYRPSEVSPTTILSPHERERRASGTESSHPHSREAKDSRPQPYRSETAGSKVLPRLRTDETLSRRDSDISTPRGAMARPLAPGVKSGSSTSRVAMTPLSTETMGAERTDQATPVAKIFQQFSRGIMGVSAQTDKNDSATRARNTSKKEEQKSQELNESFASLAEVRRREFQRNEKRSTKAEKKLRKMKGDHSAVTDSIASSFAIGGATVPSSGSDDKSKRELKTVRGELDRVQISLDKTRSELSDTRYDIDKLSREYSGDIRSLISRQENIDKLSREYSGDIRSLISRQQNTEANIVSSSVMRAMETDAAALKVNAAKIETMYKQQGQLPEQFDELKQKIRDEKLSERIDELENKIQQEKLSQRVGELEKKLQEGLSERVDELDVKTQLQEQHRSEAKAMLDTHSARLETLQSDDSNLVASVAEVKGTLDQQASDLRNLNDVISGDEGKKDGLLDNIVSAQGDIERFRKTLNTMNEDMNDFESEAKQTRSTLDTMEELKMRLETRVSKLEDSEVERSSRDSLADMTTVQEELASLSKTIQQFEQTIQDFEAEQHQKDDLVAGEVERLDNELIKQANNIARVSDERQRSVAPDPSIASLLPSNTAEERLDLNGNPEERRSEADGKSVSPLTNGIIAKQDMSPQLVEEFETKHRSIKQEVDKLHSNLQDFKSSTLDTTNTHDTFIISLQQRFDNLTSDYMVKCIIHQMQSLYPHHPGNILQELRTTQQQMQQYMGQSSGNQQHFDLVLQKLTGNFNALENLVKTNQQHVTPIMQAGCDKVQTALTQRIETESREREEVYERFQSHSLNHYSVLSAQEKDLRVKLQEDIHANIEQRLKIAAEEQQESTSIVKLEVASNLSRIQALQKGLQSLRTEHSIDLKNLSKVVQDIASNVKQSESEVPKDQVSKDQVQLLQQKLDSLNTEHATSISNLEKEIKELQTTVQNQDEATSSLDTSMEKVHTEVKGDLVIHEHELAHHYNAINHLNDHNGLKNAHVLICGLDKNPPEPCQLDQPIIPTRERSASILLGGPSSPLRAPTSLSSKPSASTGTSTGTAEAPITLDSQNTNETIDEDEDSDEPLSAARKKRKRTLTKKAEESPVRKKKSRPVPDKASWGVWDVPSDYEKAGKKKGGKQIAKPARR